MIEIVFFAAAAGLSLERLKTHSLSEKKINAISISGGRPVQRRELDHPQRIDVDEGAESAVERGWRQEFVFLFIFFRVKRESVFCLRAPLAYLRVQAFFSLSVLLSSQAAPQARTPSSFALRLFMQLQHEAAAPT